MLNLLKSILRPELPQLADPAAEALLTAAGAPANTDRARMIRQAGLEAVRKELEK